MTEQKATNIAWHEADITRDSREQLLKQKGVVLWFTGLPSSGKSTLAHTVETKLYGKGYLTYVLDGDNIRHGLNQNLGFSPEDREENIRRIGEVAKLFTDAGLIAITAFISPYTIDRRKARELVDSDRFVEIYCKCSLEECEIRDPKGLYKKARTGEIKQFTGIDAPYEAPRNPEIVVETDRFSVDQSTDIIMSYLSKNNLIICDESR